MPAGGGDLERSAALLLAVHLGQVVLPRSRLPGRADAARRVGLDGFDAQQVAHHGLEVGARNDNQPVDERRFRRVARGHEDSLEPQRPKAAGGDEDSIDVSHRPIERQLAHERRMRRRLLAGTRERDGHGDRQIQRAAFLAQLGRSEVDREALAGKLQAAVLDCRPNAFARLLY